MKRVFIPLISASNDTKKKKHIFEESINIDNIPVNHLTSLSHYLLIAFFPAKDGQNHKTGKIEKPREKGEKDKGIVAEKINNNNNNIKTNLFKFFICF